MKFSASFALIVFVAFMACSSALPARKRMAYYQQPAQYYASPQRIMYMQYVQPGRTHARSTQAASALVAGETVATGTYLKDCDHAESDVAAAGPAADDFLAESQLGEDVHVASSVAEAYPAPAESGVQVDLEQTEETSAAVASDNAAKVPREYNFETPAEVPANEAELPVPAPLAPLAPEAPVVPVNRYLPALNKNKKVIVELDQSSEADEAAAVADDEEAEVSAVEDDEEEEELLVVPIAPKYPARRPAAKKPAKASGPNKPSKPSKPAPLPVGTFFPVDFGGATGGAIAIANSFSTGESGAATSHAIAYGSPDTARTRLRPSKVH